MPPPLNAPALPQGPALLTRIQRKAARVWRAAMTRFPTKSLTLIRPVKSRFRTVQDAALPVTVNRAGTKPLNVPVSMAPDWFTTRQRPSNLRAGWPETSTTKV